MYRLVGTKTYKNDNNWYEDRIIDKDFEDKTIMESFLEQYVKENIETPLKAHYKFTKLKKHGERWMVFGGKGFNPTNDSEWQEMMWKKYQQEEEELQRNSRISGHIDSRIDDPSWRGPNGNWSLD